MELVDVLNKMKQKTGNICKRNELKSGEYRLSAHIWIMNEENKILIQKRNNNLKMYPGIWENAGGAVISREDSITAIKREVKEELGIKIDEEKLTFIASFKRYKDFVDVFYIKDDIKIKDINLKKDEVEDVRFVSFDELYKMYENKEFAKSSFEYFKMYITEYLK